jgi:hypothetical protein
MRSMIPLFAFAFAASAPVIAAEYVNAPAFRSVQLRGGGGVTLKPGPVQRVTILEGSSQITRIYVARDGQLRIDACNGHCPRNYHLRVEVQSPQVPDVSVEGGGSIKAADGFAAQERVAVAVDGGGAIDLRSIDASDVTAAVNGGGAISVRPRSQLTAAVNGGGKIRYWGNPAVTMAVHGGGSVQPGY